MKKIALLLILVLFANIVVAEKDTLDIFEEAREDFNKEVKEYSGIAKILLDNQRINIYIDNTTIGILIEDAEAKEIKEGGIKNPTLNVYTSETTINKIYKKELDFGEALKNKEVTYEVIGIKNKLRLGLIKLGIKIIDVFI